MILLLRGAPGAGKSTVAAAIAAHTPHVGIVEVDDLRSDLWHVPPAASMSDGDRHALALAHAARVAIALLGVGTKLVVVVDTFAPCVVDTFMRALRGRSDVRAVTLLVGATEHARRLATRPEVPGVYRDLRTAAAMNAELDAAHNARLDTTGLEPRDVAARVLALARSTLSASSPAATPAQSTAAQTRP